MHIFHSFFGMGSFTFGRTALCIGSSGHPVLWGRVSIFCLLYPNSIGFMVNNKDQGFFSTYNEDPSAYFALWRKAGIEVGVEVGT